MTEVEKYNCRVLNQDFLDENSRRYEGTLPTLNVLVKVNYPGAITGILCEYYNKDGKCKIKEKNPVSNKNNLECVVKEGFKEIK